MELKSPMVNAKKVKVCIFGRKSTLVSVILLRWSPQYNIWYGSIEKNSIPLVLNDSDLANMSFIKEPYSGRMVIIEQC